jgi:hypothetical protein
VEGAAARVAAMTPEEWCATALHRIFAEALAAADAAGSAAVLLDYADLDEAMLAWLAAWLGRGRGGESADGKGGAKSMRAMAVAVGGADQELEPAAEAAEAELRPEELRALREAMGSHAKGPPPPPPPPPWRPQAAGGPELGPVAAAAPEPATPPVWVADGAAKRQEASASLLAALAAPEHDCVAAYAAARAHTARLRRVARRR